MKASIRHPNRKAHNWLIYDLGDKLLEQASQYVKGDVYDLGCGSAAYREWVLDSGNSYCGVDWSNARGGANVDIICDLNKKIELPDNVADTVLSFSVLEHLYAPESFLKECFRVMKNGAYILLRVPWQWQVHEAPHDYYRYSPNGLHHLLTKAGFSVVDVRPLSGLMSTLVLKANLFTRRKIRGPRLFRRGCEQALTPFWFLGQLLAPQLDKHFDNDWDREAAAFFVIAQKKKSKDSGCD